MKVDTLKKIIEEQRIGELIKLKEEDKQKRIWRLKISLERLQGF